MGQHYVLTPPPSTNLQKERLGGAQILPAPFSSLCPLNLARGQRTTFYQVESRGKLFLGLQVGSSSSNPTAF